MSQIHNKRWMYAIFVTLLILILAIMFYDCYHQQSIVDGFEKENGNKNMYIEELNQIEKQLSQLKNQAQMDVSQSIVIAYDIYQVDDLDYIEKQEKKYGFQPVIVIDCNKTNEQIQLLFQSLQKNKYTIMLTATHFQIDDIKRVQELANKQEIKLSTLFLSRRIDKSSLETQQLKDLGFTGYTIFTDEMQSGRDNEMVYFQYTYLNLNGSKIDNRVEMISVSHQPLLLTVSLNSKAKQTLNDETIIKSLEDVQKRIDKKEIYYSSLNDIEEYLNGQTRSQKEREKIYEDYYQASKDRIKFLKEKIAEK